MKWNTNSFVIFLELLTMYPYKLSESVVALSVIPIFGQQMLLCIQFLLCLVFFTVPTVFPCSPGHHVAQNLAPLQSWTGGWPEASALLNILRFGFSPLLIILFMYFCIGHFLPLFFVILTCIWFCSNVLYLYLQSLLVFESVIIIDYTHLFLVPRRFQCLVHGQWPTLCYLCIYMSALPLLRSQSLWLVMRVPCMCFLPAFLDSVDASFSSC